MHACASLAPSGVKRHTYKRKTYIQTHKHIYTHKNHAKQKKKKAAKKKEKRKKCAIREGKKLSTNEFEACATYHAYDNNCDICA